MYIYHAYKYVSLNACTHATKGKLSPYAFACMLKRMKQETKREVYDSLSFIPHHVHPPAPVHCDTECTPPPFSVEEAMKYMWDGIKLLTQQGNVYGTSILTPPLIQCNDPL